MKKIFILSIILSCCITEKAYCVLNTTVTKNYTDNNGNTVNSQFVFNSNGVHSWVGNVFGGDHNYIEVDDDGNTIYNGLYYPARNTFIVNSKGEILARKPHWNANIDETYQYTDTGKVLRYNTSGELLGAYEDSAQALLAAFRYRNDSLTDANGNFTDYDEKGNILGTYYANGNVDSYKYNYDSGGNLISAYKNGVVTSTKTLYTLPEAAAAVKEDNSNTVTITFK